jgi:hypothetical protein
MNGPFGECGSVQQITGKPTDVYVDAAARIYEIR